MAEAVAGQRLNETKDLEAVPLEGFFELKQQLEQSSARDSYTRWAKWFLADRGSRTISPSFATTVPEYIERRIQENTLLSLKEAVSLSPTNGLALARLARTVLDQDPAQNPRSLAEAAFFCDRAEVLTPNEPEAQCAKAEILDRKGSLMEALDVLSRAVERWPKTTNLIETRAFILERNGRQEEAYQTFVEMIDLLGPTDARSLLASSRRPFSAQWRPPTAAELSRADWLLRRATELDPTDAEAWSSRARLFEHTGKPSEAFKTMETASSLNPPDPAFWSDWGRMLMKTNRLDEATLAFTKAVELASSDPVGNKQLLDNARSNKIAVLQMLNR